MRGQGNIYSDVTFRFYEVGKWCRSRKRAARDVPAWEAAGTPSTARSQLWRAMAWLGQEPRMGLGMGSQAPSGNGWTGRSSEEPLLGFSRPPRLSQAHSPRAFGDHLDFFIT